MESPLAIVIAVDGLRAAALGAYGNTTFPTPQLDLLASHSSVAEWLLADSTSLAQFYRAAWQGCYGLQPAAPERSASMLENLQRCETRSWLVTDDSTIAALGRENCFDEVRWSEPKTEPVATEIHETQLGQFFSQAIEKCVLWHKDVSQHRGGLLWLHTRGLTGAWDAPRSLCESLLDEEEIIEVPAIRQPPQETHASGDPDVMLGLQVAYAAQVSVLDSCLGGFLDSIHNSWKDPMLTMLVGTRGFSLGEHGHVGYDCASLYGEQLHLPWLTKVGRGIEPRPRIAGFCHPSDLASTLLDWFGALPAGDDSWLPAVIAHESSRPFPARNVAVARGRGAARMIRTPAWMLLSGEEDTADRLYAKPDDRWEMNDVASLCPQQVEQLKELLATIESSCASGGLPFVRELPDELLIPHR